MKHTTPQSLLSLPPEMQVPEAYRVLGLAALESDKAKVRAAVEARLNQLKEMKDSADKAAWEKAIVWVKNAQAILGDPGKKAAYDRKLAAETPAKPPAIDPLSGMLPGAILPGTSAQPAGRVQPPAVPLLFRPGSTASSGPPAYDPLSGALPGSGPPGVPVQSAAIAVAPTIPVFKGRSSSKRKRGLPWTSILLSLFCLISIAGLGALIWAVKSGNSIVINTGSGPLFSATDGSGQMVAPPMNVSEREKQPHDPVMGGLEGKMSHSSDRTSEDAMAPPARAVDPSVKPAPEMPAAPTSPTMPEVPAAMVPAPEMPTPVPPIPEMPVPSEPTPEEVKAGEAALAAVIAAIKQHDWEKLKPLAEKATAVAAGDMQKDHAEMFFQLVDLATFYRGAIVKSIGTLQAGNELDLTDDLKLVVVEVSANKLIVRFNGKNKEYTFDTLPLSLSHKLAKLSLSGDSPTTQAAMYAFQAIAPVTTQAYRNAAIAGLEKITDEVEGAEPAKLVEALQLLYRP